MAGIIYLNTVCIEGNDQPRMIEALGHGLELEGKWSVSPRIETSLEGEETGKRPGRTGRKR